MLAVKISSGSLAHPPSRLVGTTVNNLLIQGTPKLHCIIIIISYIILRYVNVHIFRPVKLPSVGLLNENNFILDGLTT